MLTNITKTILSQIPDNVKLSPEDIAVIHQNKDYVISLKESISKNFYDILYANEVTKNIFHEGERPVREKSLEMWIVKTFNSDFDDKYWEWQTFVGILHIKREVKNNMMVSMVASITEQLTERAILDFENKEEAIALLKAWLKLSGIITSLVVEGYRLFYLKALENVTGLSERLLDNTVKVEIDNLVAENQRHRL